MSTELKAMLLNMEQNITKRLDKMAGRLDKVDSRLDKMDGRLDRLEQGQENMLIEMRSNTKHLEKTVKEHRVVIDLLHSKK